MSFGTEGRATPTNGGSLAGFLVSKATQSRKEAKKKDKKDGRKKKKKEEKQQKSSGAMGGLGGALSSITNIFKPDKGKPEQVKETKQRTSGGATGLAKILTHGFGSLTAGTLGLAGGLAAVTNILNQQLKAQSFTATGVQTISAILSDQLENQSSIVSSVKSLRPGGGGGKGGKSMFGTSKAKGTSSDTLSGYITEKVNQAIQQATGVGAGAVLGNLLKGSLTNPMTYAYLLAAVGSFMRMKEVERMKPFVDETQQQIDTENKSEKTPWYQKLGNFFAGQALSSPQGPSNQIGLPVPGSMHSEGGFIPKESKYSSGTIKFTGGITKYAGGRTSMIGEAGKEAVVDLNSRQSRGMFNGSSESIGDPGMKASGASTLAVVDQFVKGMGPLGAPVSQALGADISNLTRTFGMAQTLPNIKMGGGKFKEDGNAKKTRDKFLQDLISGSLEALDAKKKDDNARTTPPPNPTTKEPPPPGTNNPVSNPPASNQPSSNKPMDGRYSDPTSQSGAAIPDLTTGEAKTQGLDKKEVKQRYLPFPPNSKWHDKYHILLNSGNGSYEVWEKPGVFNWVPKQIFLGKKENVGAIKNSQIGREAHNEVRAFMRIHMPDTAKNVFKWISEVDINNANAARVNGNQEKGGRVKPVYDKGGSAVQKPWWDFLGWVTGMKSVEQGKTGVYSNNLMGKMAERTAQTNAAMMKELGYEKGGSMFGTEGSQATPIEKLEHRVKIIESLQSVYVRPADARAGFDPSKERRLPAKSSVTPVAATSQEGSEMGSAAIINIISSGDSGGAIPTSSSSPQSSMEYISNPWPNGLSGVICTSPWSVV